MESKISFGSNLLSSLSGLEDCSRAHSPLYIASSTHVSEISTSACEMNSYDTASGLYSNVASSSSTLASGVNIIDTSDDSYVTPGLVNAAHQVMMSDGAHIDYPYVILPETKQDPLHFHISISLRGRKRTIKCSAMVDSGATSMFISHKFVARQRMLKEPLPRKIVLYNIDGTINKAGTIEDKVSLYLRIGDQERKWDFLVTDLGPEDVILGLPWLRHVNPAID